MQQCRRERASQDSNGEALAAGKAPMARRQGVRGKRRRSSLVKGLRRRRQWWGRAIGCVPIKTLELIMPLRGHQSKQNRALAASKAGTTTTSAPATESRKETDTTDVDGGGVAKKRKKHSRANGHSFRKEKLRAIDKLKGALPQMREMSNLTSNEEDAIKFLKTKGVMECPDDCPRCGNATKVDHKGKRVRCRRRGCARTAPTRCEHCLCPDQMRVVTSNPETGSTTECECVECHWTWRLGDKGSGKELERSINIGSLLQCGRIQANTFMHLLCLWLLKCTVQQASIQTGIDRKSVGTWFKHFRQLVAEMTMSECSENVALGGLDENGDPIVVEIDESKFAKRKCNKGRRANGDWVFGMVERTQERKCVMVVVKDGTADTLLPIITHFVKEGSIIHSDMWGAHNSIGDTEDKEYIHKTLCHDIEFVAPDGVHTQTIEGNWSAAKRDIPLQQREGEDLQEYLFEFMWRRQNGDRLWDAIFEGLAKVRYSIKELGVVVDERTLAGGKLQEDEEAADANTAHVQPAKTPKGEEELPLSCDSYDGKSSDNTTCWHINKCHADAFDNAVTAPKKSASDGDDRHFFRGGVPSGVAPSNAASNADIAPDGGTTVGEL